MPQVDKLLLDVYSENIEEYAKNSTDIEFFNSGDDHAQIVLTNIAKYSKKYIHIYSGNLCTDVSNNEEYLKYLRLFLIQGGNIQVLLCEFENGDNPLNKDIYKLFSQFKSNVTVKETKTILQDSNKNTVHFTVADDKSYRLETDTIKKKARCNFNSPETTKLLNKLFEKIFNNSASLKLELNNDTLWN
ncbi:MAG: hypothetical protein PHS84_01120 [Paludibacter sp.]|jgi:hypothetical protein|nr:hypothetical protein [Paludibacter sp.]